MPAKTTRYLTVRLTDNAPRVWALPVAGDLVVQIGRNPTPEDSETVGLTLAGEEIRGIVSVSHNHARLIRRKEVYWVEDLIATNPTCVNGKMVLSFQQVKPPFDLQLGEVSLHVSEESLTQEQLCEIREGNPSFEVVSEPVKTRTMNSHMRREWPDIHEELRWADALKQVLDAVREAFSSTTAQDRVSEILAVFLGAHNTRLLFNVSRDALGDTLVQAGIGELDCVVDMLNSMLDRGRSGEDAFLVPVLPHSCIFARPANTRHVKAAHLCVAQFSGDISAIALEASSARLIGLSLNLMETFSKTVIEIADSRQKAQKNTSIVISDRMKELCQQYHYWGESPRFQLMLQEADLAARKALVESSKVELRSILLVGEPGVGKTALAEIIHALSNHASGHFLEINCATIVETMAEAFLFGSVKGMGTNVSEIKGYFEQVDDGVLMLDEIGTLPLEIQAKLLRVLQKGVYRRLGETRDRRTNCHVIAATNADLDTMKREGTFRADIYARICNYEIRIPPLRERPEDIPLIIDRKIAALNADKKLIESLKTPVPKVLNAKVLDALCAYHWPENVRELVESIEGAFRFSDDLEIGFENLPPKIFAELRRTTSVHVQHGFAVNLGEDLDHNVARMQLEYFARLMRQHNGALGEVGKHAGVAPGTFIDRRKNLFPQIVAKLDEQERNRLRDLAGPYWEALVTAP